MRLRALLVILLSASIASVVRAEEGVPAVVEFRTGEQVERWQFELGSAGVPATKVQRDAWQALLGLYDVNEDGQLSADESPALPSPFGIRQLPTGRVLPTMTAPRGSIDTNEDGQISFEEFLRYYQTGGDSGVLVTYGIAPNNRQLSEALAKQLGLYAKEVLTEQLVQQRAQQIMSLDANGDELLGPGELIAGFKYPGTTATRLIRDTQGQQLPCTLITDAKKSANVHWAIDVSEKQIARDGQARPVDSLRSPACWVRIHVANSAASIAVDRLNNVAQQYKDLAEALGGEVTWEDVKDRPNQIDMKHLVPLADANRDGTLTAAELKQWRSVFGKLLESLFVVSILDFEQNLFTCLDENYDGSLSSVELENAWQQLDAAGVLVDGKFVPEKLPRQIRIVASLGFPKEYTQQQSGGGPPWFQAMDRNHDGHISLNEFPAGEEPFRQLDADGDGKISLSDLNQK